MIKTGIELIAQEREEQINKHGRTLESDAEINKHGELAQVARYLCSTIPVSGEYPRNWSQSFRWHVDKNKSRIERLVIAGALIAAEIDRLQALDTTHDKGKEEVTHGENCKNISTACENCINEFLEWKKNKEESC